MHKMSCYFLMGIALAKMVCVVVAYLQADLITLVRNRVRSFKNMTVLQLNVFIYLFQSSQPYM